MAVNSKSLVDYNISQDYFDRYFWPKVYKTDTCWWWHRPNVLGYGQFSVRIESKPVSFLAHRVSYELVKGFIPTGLVVDHLCQNPLCVNPDHLEAVSHFTNLLRSNNFVSVNMITTHCPRGHKYTLENTRASKTNRRACKICHRERERDRRARKVHHCN